MDVTPVVTTATTWLTETILTGTRTPGTAVTEREVMDHTGVSRATARTALARAGEVGLLRRRPNASYVVPVMTIDDIADVFRVRRLIESHAVTAAPRDAPLAPLVASVDSMMRLARSTPRHVVVALDMDFHRALVARAGSPRLDHAFAGVATEAQLTMVHSHHLLGTSRIAAEHHAVAELLRDDRDAAVAALHRHLDDAVQLLSGVVADRQGPPG